MSRHVGQLPCGLWLLVERFDEDGPVYVSTREHPSHTWSPPTELEAK